MKVKMVKIYTTPGCPYCEMVKDYLKNKGIAYTEHDVALDELAREEMFNLSHQEGVPVVEIEGNIIIGFNRGEIDKVLGL
jgi:glutaredoxin 3